MEWFLELADPYVYRGKNAETSCAVAKLKCMHID
jgi:hypothetical protein